MPPELAGALIDVRDAARYFIDDKVDVTFEAFVGDQRQRQSVLYSFMVIGEALNRLRRRDVKLAQGIPDVDEVVAMRNVLIHGYDVTDYEIVWSAIKEKLPILVSHIEAILPEQDR